MKMKSLFITVLSFTLLACSNMPKQDLKSELIGRDIITSREKGLSHSITKNEDITNFKVLDEFINKDNNKKITIAELGFKKNNTEVSGVFSFESSLIEDKWVLDYASIKDESIPSFVRMDDEGLRKALVRKKLIVSNGYYSSEKYFIIEDFEDIYNAEILTSFSHTPYVDEITISVTFQEYNYQVTGKFFGTAHLKEDGWEIEELYWDSYSTNALSYALNQEIDEGQLEKLLEDKFGAIETIKILSSEIDQEVAKSNLRVNLVGTNSDKLEDGIYELIVQSDIKDGSWHLYSYELSN